MKSVAYKLQELLTYYLATRQCGHTTLMKQGRDNYTGQKLILAADYKSGKELSSDPNKEVISLNSLEKLRGSNKPLAIDNATMTILLQDTLDELLRLENENKKLKEIKNNILKILNE